MTHREASRKAAKTGATARRARGTVERAGGGVVRRVATYVDLPTFEKLKARCGDSLTQSEVLAEALRRHLERP